jgi:predicted XRE-type DNA-binding protein
MERGEATIVFKDVPADVCDTCGEAYLDEDVSAAVYEEAEAAVEAGVQLKEYSFTAMGTTNNVEFNGPYETAFDALEDPDRAANLKVRSKLMSRLTSYIREEELTQEEAAERLEVSQPRISFLTNGKISKFTIDYLLNMCIRAGIEVDVVFDGAHVEDEV